MTRLSMRNGFTNGSQTLAYLVKSQRNHLKLLPVIKLLTQLHSQPQKLVNLMAHPVLQSHVLFLPKEVFEVQLVIFKKFFKDKHKLSVSAISTSAMNSISKYTMRSPKLFSKQIPIFSTLATSAMHHRGMAEGTHVLYNLEITAALLNYVVVKVWVTSNHYSMLFILQGALIIPETAELKDALGLTELIFFFFPPQRFSQHTNLKCKHSETTYCHSLFTHFDSIPSSIVGRGYKFHWTSCQESPFYGEWEIYLPKSICINKAIGLDRQA